MKKCNLFKFWSVILAIAGITSCSENAEFLDESNNESSANENKEEVSFIASFEEIEEDTIDLSDLTTRTMLRTGNTSIWVANDAISVWLDGQMEKFVTLSGGERAVFEGLASSMSSIGSAYALYSYDENAEI